MATKTEKMKSDGVKKKHPGGRPTKYDPKYNKIVAAMAELGATNDYLAKAFGVANSTISKWLSDVPEFSEALKTGRESADSKVAKSLFQRACGYSHEEDKIFNNDGEALVVHTTRHYPPDTTACIFWLKNRRPQEWRDKQDIGLSSEDNKVKIEVEFVGDKKGANHADTDQ